MMSRSRLRPGKESLQNYADWSILNSKFVVVLFTMPTQQKLKTKSKLYASNRACPTAI